MTAGQDQMALPWLPGHTVALPWLPGPLQMSVTLSSFLWECHMRAAALDSDTGQGSDGRTRVHGVTLWIAIWGWGRVYMGSCGMTHMQVGVEGRRPWSCHAPLS